MLPSLLSSLLAVLWLLLPCYLASAFATFPRGRGPPMDLGRVWARDGRRVLGPSKTWSGFLVGSLLAIPFGVLEAGLILAAPPDLTLVPTFGPTLAASVPVATLLAFGAMAGDTLGSFVKRRLNRPSGARAWFLDQMPFVVVPVGLGLLLFPAVFAPVFLRWEGLLWLVVFTLGLHAAFNWVGFKAGLKKVPW